MPNAHKYYHYYCISLQKSHTSGHPCHEQTPLSVFHTLWWQIALTRFASNQPSLLSLAVCCREKMQRQTLPRHGLRSPWNLATNHNFDSCWKNMHKHFYGAIRNAPNHGSFVVTTCDNHATVRRKTTRSDSSPATLQRRICPRAWYRIPQAGIAIKWAGHQLAPIWGKFYFVNWISMRFNWRKGYFFETSRWILMPNFDKFVTENNALICLSKIVVNF